MRPDACASLLTAAGEIKWTKEEPAGVNAELRSLFKSSGARSVFFYHLGTENVISAGMLRLASLSPARLPSAAAGRVVMKGDAVSPVRAALCPALLSGGRAAWVLPEEETWRVGWCAGSC